MFRSSHTQAAPLSPPFHGAACFCVANPFPNRLPSIGATATTAAGGGNRESLLGQRPARRKCFLKHKADAGGRNPALSAKQTERLYKGQPANYTKASPGFFPRTLAFYYTTKHHSGVVMSRFQYPRPAGRYDFSEWRRCSRRHKSKSPTTHAAFQRYIVGLFGAGDRS